jgi:hypothetical protein
MKFQPTLLQSLVVPIGIFLLKDTMLSTTRTIKVSSEDCQKLPRLGTLENFFNSLIERQFGIYYDGEKKTSTATGNRRAATGAPNNIDTNTNLQGKTFMDDSKRVSADVRISYLPRRRTNCYLECSRHCLSEVFKK